MDPVNTYEYDALHASLGRSKKDEPLKGRTSRPVDTLNPFERKREFYGLLKDCASPGVVSQVQGFRSRFQLGLVQRSHDGEITTSLNNALLDSFARAHATGKPLEIADTQYRAMRETLLLAGETWQNAMIAEKNLDYARMDELMEPQMRVKYGDKPVSKRVASATAQTVGVGLGFQELASRMYTQKSGVRAGPEHMLQAHKSGLRIAMVWANFNRFELLELEKHIRHTRTDHEGIEPLKNEGVFDIARDGSMSFIGRGVLDSIAAEKIDISEGRFGCPGKKFIPQLWEWTEAVSAEHGLLKDGLVLRGNDDVPPKIS